MTEEYYMGLAIEQAKLAASIGEVPVGAVIVWKDVIIGQGYNRVETDKNPLRHAEIIAIEEASEKLGAWRLLDTTLYVTLEPCAMCAGAMIHGRVGRIVYGASDPKRGCAGSVLNLIEHPAFNHRCELIRGVRGEECAGLLSDFFKKLREERKK
ncbi:MAG: tRNA adenosine(34) deaminase TadA [Tissierellia bacterium]|nr:tRNA adenosine(34) deaminase TadA [Tissierellia bacterium]